MTDKNNDLSFDPFSIAWAAGLLEGEGCFVFHRRHNKNRHCCVAIHCEMTDEDTVLKLQSVFNLGSVLLRPNIAGRVDRRQRKPTYIWSVQNKAGVKRVCDAVLPYMGKRRSAKIKQLLEYINEGIIPECYAD